MFALYGLIFNLIVFSANSQLLTQLSEADCAKCCNAAATAFQDFPFDVNICQTVGCVRERGEGQQCVDTFPETTLANESRAGCEIGRDFITTGLTTIASDAVLQICQVINNAPIILLQALEIDATKFIREVNQCSNCCSSLDSIVNINEDSFQDFALDSCQNSCGAPIKPGIAQENHVDRTGILIALDFLQVGETFLGGTDFSCGENGQVKVISEDDGVAPSVIIIAIIGGLLAIVGVVAVIFYVSGNNSNDFTLELPKDKNNNELRASGLNANSDVEVRLKPRNNWDFRDGMSYIPMSTTMAPAISLNPRNETRRLQLSDTNPSTNSMRTEATNETNNTKQQQVDKPVLDPAAARTLEVVVVGEEEEEKPSKKKRRKKRRNKAVPTPSLAASFVPWLFGTKPRKETFSDADLDLIRPTAKKSSKDGNDQV